MGPFQYWLEHTLFNLVAPVTSFMRTAWGWPAIESAHFIGLALLFGSIATWDLRLLGVARRVPIAAFHRLVPFAVLGFAINITSGFMFLMTEPDQYIYNPSFHLKTLFMLAAGLNASVFYSTSYRAALVRGETPPMPPHYKWFGLASLLLWMLVIVTGRALTFYRPFPCEPESTGWLATCIPGFFGR